MDIVNKPINIFCCYARNDQLFLLELKKHLSALEREKLITLWADININAGAEWEEEITRHLNVAQIILLLVSADFIASDYCYSIEMQQAMQRHESGEAHVIPIILRPVLWQGTPFGKLQALPIGAIPITNHQWYHQDEAFCRVAEGVKYATKVILAEEKRKRKMEEKRVRQLEKARQRQAQEQARRAEEEQRSKVKEAERIRRAEEEQQRQAEAKRVRLLEEAIQRQAQEQARRVEEQRSKTQEAERIRRAEEEQQRQAEAKRVRLLEQGRQYQAQEQARRAKEEQLRLLRKRDVSPSLQQSSPSIAAPYSGRVGPFKDYEEWVDYRDKQLLTGLYSSRQFPMRYTQLAVMERAWLKDR